MTSIATAVLNKYNGVEAEPAKVTQPRVHANDVVMTEAHVAFKQDLLGKLHKGVWSVHFEKADGTMSTMECTLDPRLLPARDPSTITEAKRPEVPHLIHVYAVDRQGWRSFRVPNVRNFTPVVTSFS